MLTRVSLMDPFRLKVFQSAAINLSFTKASQELLISQPAVTNHIHALESVFNVRLFDRHNGRISLTEAGQLLLEHTRQIGDAYRRMEYEMHMLQDTCCGDLHLGASTTIAQYVLPVSLGRFISRFPKVNLSLYNGNSRDVETALQEHRIDLGLVEGVFRLPGMHYEKFLEDELVAVVSTKSRLSHHLPDEISIEQLLHIPLVLREWGSGTLDVIEQALLAKDVRLANLDIRLHLGNTESIKLFLENSECMGIISIRSVARELNSGTFRVVDIEGLNMVRDFYFVELQGQNVNLAQNFKNFVRQNVK